MWCLSSMDLSCTTVCTLRSGSCHASVVQGARIWSCVVRENDYAWRELSFPKHNFLFAGCDAWVVWICRVARFSPFGAAAQCHASVVQGARIWSCLCDGILRFGRMTIHGVNCLFGSIILFLAGCDAWVVWICRVARFSPFGAAAQCHASVVQGARIWSCLCDGILRFGRMTIHGVNCLFGSIILFLAGCDAWVVWICRVARSSPFGCDGRAHWMWQRTDLMISLIQCDSCCDPVDHGSYRRSVYAIHATRWAVECASPATWHTALTHCAHSIRVWSPVFIHTWDFQSGDIWCTQNLLQPLLQGDLVVEHYGKHRNEGRLSLDILMCECFLCNHAILRDKVSVVEGKGAFLYTKLP